jgi:hypothetical protein
MKMFSSRIFGFFGSVVPSLVAIALCATTIRAQDAAQAPRLGQAAQSPADDEAVFYHWAFQRLTSAASVRSQLDKVLKQKIDVIDHVCNLTDEQRQKCQLAGRGDIERVFDGIDELKKKYQLVKDDRKAAMQLLQANEPFRNMVKFIGPFGDEFLFERSVETTLTDVQRVKFAPVRQVFRVGGQVQLVQQGADLRPSISVYATPFNDDDLSLWNRRTDVQGFNLGRTLVTNDGLKHLEGMTSLNYLGLQQTQITDAGLSQLKEFTDLQTLVLDYTQVSDAGLINLLGLTKLNDLRLNKTQITDAGAADVARLTAIQTLDLSSTQVTDVGLGHLKTLTNLRLLLLGNTIATKAGIAKLRQELPRSNIVTDGMVF